MKEKEKLKRKKQILITYREHLGHTQNTRRKHEEHTQKTRRTHSENDKSRHLCQLLFSVNRRTAEAQKPKTFHIAAFHAHKFSGRSEYMSRDISKSA